jgi:integral membrane protein (TIGR01906 family)
VSAPVGRTALSALVTVATAFAIVAACVTAFMNPWWFAFEQARADVPAWTGFTASEIRTATDSILSDLVVGPPAFDVEVRGAPVLDANERGHMRDVRQVFLGFWAIAAVAAVLLVAAWVAARRGAAEGSFRSAVRRGSIGLAVGVVVVAALALVAFEPLFELMHRVLFPGGNWTFDPSTERLVQLFPYQLWVETSLAVGAAILVVAAAVAVLARSRERAASGAALPSATGEAVR